MDTEAQPLDSKALPLPAALSKALGTKDASCLSRYPGTINVRCFVLSVLLVLCCPCVCGAVPLPAALPLPLLCVALCVALRCGVLRCVALRCVALRCVALHCLVLCWILLCLS